MNFYLLNNNVLGESELPNNIEKKDLFKYELKTGVPSEEKHVPFIEILNNCIKVKTGQNEMHPMEEAHHIVWFKLEIDDNIIDTIILDQAHTPETVFLINDIELVNRKIRVYAYCNVHGV